MNSLQADLIQMIRDGKPPEEIEAQKAKIKKLQGEEFRKNIIMKLQGEQKIKKLQGEIT
jgi:hypothetical protein